MSNYDTLTKETLNECFSCDIIRHKVTNMGGNTKRKTKIDRMGATRNPGSDAGYVLHRSYLRVISVLPRSGSGDNIELVEKYLKAA